MFVAFFGKQKERKKSFSPFPSAEWVGLPIRNKWKQRKNLKVSARRVCLDPECSDGFCYQWQLSEREAWSVTEKKARSRKVLVNGIKSGERRSRRKKDFCGPRRRRKEKKWNLWSSKGNFKRSQRQDRIRSKEWRFGRLFTPFSPRWLLIYDE